MAKKRNGKKNKRATENRTQGKVGRLTWWLIVVVATAVIAKVAQWYLPQFLPGPKVQATYQIIDRGPCYNVEITTGAGRLPLERLAWSIQVPAEDIQYAVSANSLDFEQFRLLEPIIVGESNGHCVFAVPPSSPPPNVHATMSNGVPKRIEVYASDFRGLLAASVLIPKGSEFDAIFGRLEDRPVILDGQYQFSKWGVSVERKLVFTVKK